MNAQDAARAAPGAAAAALLDQFGRPLAAPARGTGGTAPRVRAIGGNSVGFHDAASYDAPETADWMASLASPDIENNFTRDIVVARIRDLVRNDGWASGAITRITDNVVGGNLRLVAKPDWRALRYIHRSLDRVWADEFGRAAEALWRTWSTDPGRWCDAGRRHTIGSLFRLAFRTKLVDGEALALLPWLPGRMGPGRARYATAVQLVDPDRLSNPHLGIDSPTRRAGVELDEYGAATGYHIREAHQSDWFNAAASVRWRFVARETAFGRPLVVHDYDSDRADEHRGTGGVLKPVLQRFRMLAQADRVEIQTRLVNAMLAAYIESPYDPAAVQDALDPEGGDVGSYQSLRSEFHNDRRLKLGNARLPTLFPGEKIVAVDSKRNGADYDAFEHAMLRNGSSALGLSAEQVSQDWSRTNYSSARAALLEAWKTLARRRDDFATGFASPIYGAFLEEAMDRGELPLPAGAPDFIEARAEYTACRWMGPPRGWIDPMGEAQAAVLRMEAGLSTLEQECAEQGADWEDVIEQRAIERERFAQLGMQMPPWFGTQNAGPGGVRGEEKRP